jgi:hypothetical protein
MRGVHAPLNHIATAVVIVRVVVAVVVIIVVRVVAAVADLGDPEIIAGEVLVNIESDA